MLYYDRIYLSEGIDFAKSNNGVEYIVRHYWFFNHAFKFEDPVCNGFHDLMMLRLNLVILLLSLLKMLTIVVFISRVFKGKMS